MPMPILKVPRRQGASDLIRFNKVENAVTFECWPRDVFVLEKGARQFTGWPVTVKMD